MTTIAELVEGDWQEILLEEIYDKDSTLLMALVQGSRARCLNQHEIAHALMDAANKYVGRVNALPALDDGC